MTSMERALALSQRALGAVSPNPAVGAVVVKDGQIIGEGFTQPPGGDHAEIVALRQAGEQAAGSTLFVTLEPCSRHGRTPPCVAAILDAGIAEVFVSIVDPNPKENGRGIAALRAAGVNVVVGEGEQAARQTIEAYDKHIRTGIPFVSAKFAMTLDGRTATRTGDSRWVTGTEARRYVHELRSTHDAIMAGIGTVLADNPRLTARDDDGSLRDHQPKKVVVDSRGRTPPDAALLNEPGTTLIAVASEDVPTAAALTGRGAEIVACGASGAGVDLSVLLDRLGRRETTSMLVEGGSALLGSLFDQGLVDKVYAFVAPKIVGGEAAPGPVGGTGIALMADALDLERVEVARFGPDILVSGYPIRSREQ